MDGVSAAHAVDPPWPNTVDKAFNDWVFAQTRCTVRWGYRGKKKPGAENKLTAAGPADQWPEALRLARATLVAHS